nr:hypothetical protein [Rhizobium sp. CFBP 8752]
MVDPCANLRMGTAMFAKILRFVAKRYGNPRSEEVSRCCSMTRSAPGGRASSRMRPVTG